MKTSVRKLFKIANEIISISNSISNQPVMRVTTDVPNITQPNTQYTVIKIINTIQSYLVKFNITIYITTDHQLYHIISMTPQFFNCQNEPRFFPNYCSMKKLELIPAIDNY
jgi:hypothetical protein